MTSFNEVIELNNEATDFVVGVSSRFDETTADLVLRNAAVVADRLTPSQYFRLSDEAQESLKKAAASALEIAPSRIEDLEKLPHETTLDYIYRINVWQPLHSLQARVHVGEIDTGDTEQLAKVKRAIWLASTAFERVTSDAATQEFPEVQRTLHYFKSNASTAVGRAERLRA
jgi:hypothetical protein